MPKIDARWSHRVGSPALAVPPFDTVGAQKTSEWKDVAFRLKVVHVLENAHVRVLGYDLVRRVRPGQDASQTPLTLLVTSDVSLEGQYSAWKVAVYDLRSLLDRASREDIVVEITDIKTAEGVVSTPLVGCTPELIIAWNHFQPSLLEEIQAQQWLAADIVLREIGELHPVSVPTLLITAKDADLAIWWDDIVPRLYQLLPPTMDLEILYAPHLTMQTSSDDQDAEDSDVRPNIYSTMDDYDGTVQMGASMGVDQPANSGSGTVGAVVRLKDAKGHETLCALTNHHVVATRQGNSVINTQIPAGEFLGLDHEISCLGLVQVKAPSNKDHERFIKYKTMEKKENDQTLARFEGPHLFGHSLAQRNVEATDTDWQTLDQDPNRLLGTVLASSGFRVCNNKTYTPAEAQTFSNVAHVPNYALREQDGTMPQSLAEKIDGRTLEFGLNWAVIKLATSRNLSDRTPYRGSGVKVPTGARVSQFTHIRHHETYKVAKKGRTTGWTYGQINEIGSLLNLRPADKTSIVPVDMGERFGPTNAVMLAFGIVHDQKNKDFMLAGDSGSCVLLNERNEKATLVGLLYASNEYTRVSYMIPFDLVVQDIEYVTGQKVVQPEFVDYDARA